MKKKNQREEIAKNSIELNTLMHKKNIRESVRAQFVGSCLVALNEDSFSDLEQKFKLCDNTEDFLDQIKKKL